MEFHQWYLKSIKEAEERNQRDSERKAINIKEYTEDGILDILGDASYNPSDSVEDDLFRLDDDGGYTPETYDCDEDGEDSTWHVF